jgi:hypothetical protein
MLHLAAVDARRAESFRIRGAHTAGRGRRGSRGTSRRVTDATRGG